MTAAAAALLVIDLQRRYTAPQAPFELPGASELVDRTNLFARRMRSRGVVVIWIARIVRPQLGPGRRSAQTYDLAVFYGDNAKLDGRLDRQAADILVNKPRQSAFFGTDLDSLLRGLGCGKLLLAGVTTNVCVLATAQDAAARDYDVTVIQDLTASLPIRSDGQVVMAAEAVQAAALAFIRYSLGTVSRSDEVAFA